MKKNGAEWRPAVREQEPAQRRDFGITYFEPVHV
jgi:hypothetical protein